MASKSWFTHHCVTKIEIFLLSVLCRINIEFVYVCCLGKCFMPWYGHGIFSNLSSK